MQYLSVELVAIKQQLASCGYTMRVGTLKRIPQPEGIYCVIENTQKQIFIIRDEDLLRVWDKVFRQFVSNH